MATVFPSLGNQFISSKQGGTIYERNASNCTATLLEFCVRHRTEPVCLTEVDLPSNEFHSSSQSGTLLRYFFPQYAASGGSEELRASGVLASENTDFLQGVTEH